MNQTLPLLTFVFTLLSYFHLLNANENNRGVINYYGKLLDDRSSDDGGEFLSARPVHTMTKDNKLILTFDIEPPRESKTKFNLRHSTLTKAILLFNVHSCDAASEEAGSYIVADLYPVNHLKGSGYINTQAHTIKKFNTRSSTFYLDFTIALRPYIYEDSKVQESKTTKFQVKFELSLFNITGKISYIQFYSSKYSKNLQMTPKLSMQFSTETFYKMHPRIVPNNFSTNINVNGNFNLNDSYVCGIAPYILHQHNLTRASMVFTLPQKPHNSTDLVCEIPAIRIKLKECSISDDRDNWNRCYSDYILYIMREVNVGIDPNGHERNTKSFLPIVYSGKNGLNNRIIQVTDHRNFDSFKRSETEWNSQNERKGGYHGWNGEDHIYFGKQYDPNDFGIYKNGYNYEWNPNWERDFYYRDPNIFNRYHGTKTLSDREILEDGYSI